MVGSDQRESHTRELGMCVCVCVCVRGRGRGKTRAVF